MAHCLKINNSSNKSSSNSNVVFCHCGCHCRRHHFCVDDIICCSYVVYFMCCVVSYEDAQDYADLQDAVFIETSAKTAVNVSALFLEISTSTFVPRFFVVCFNVGMFVC